jgi:hypothetical protein
VHDKAPEMKLLSLRRGVAPSFLIVGAQKAGTTSLHWLLSQHPSLAGTKPKELHFFDRKNDYDAQRSGYERNFRKGLPFFPLLAFESTPNYLYRPGCAARIQETYPHIKLIVVLRNPTERAFSAWRMYRNLVEQGHFSAEQVAQRNLLPGHQLHKHVFGVDGGILPLEELIDIEMALPDGVFEPSIVRRGFYLEQLRAYWRHFPKEQIFLAGFGELRSTPHSVLSRLCEFLGVSPTPLSNIELPKMNASGESKTVSFPKATRTRLEQIYENPNRALFEEIGPLDW